MLEVAVSTVALGVYVYLIGWLVSWVRLTAARLPGDLVSAALDDRQLFVFGIRTSLFMAVLFAVACVVAYVASRPNWDANGPDWHEVINSHGLGRARGQVTDEAAQRAWKARRQSASSGARARHAARVAGALRKIGLNPLAERASAVQARAEAIVDAPNPAAAARAGRSERRAGVAGRLRLGRLANKAEGEKVQYDRERAIPAGEQQLEPPAPLGDRAVRIVAGFNVIVISAVLGLTAARLVELVFPNPTWLTIAAWALAALAVWALLTSLGPLRFGPQLHGFVWALAAAAAGLVSAPLGLLLIGGVAVATLGRALARVARPGSVSGLLRSPLPWALLTFYALVGLAYYATPPVSFPRVVVDTTSGERAGGFLNRTSAGVYLVTCTPLADATSTDERVALIRPSAVKSITLGGPQARLDSGERPSLATLGFRALGVDAHIPTLLRADLRARTGTCAGALPGALTVGTEMPALGTGAIVGPPPSTGRAHDGEPPIEMTSPVPVAKLARLYQPTVEATVADRFWPVSVGALLEDFGPYGGGRTCVVSAGKPCATATSLASLAPAGSHKEDYLRYPAKPVGDPTNQFHAFESGQYTSTGSLHQWLADPGLLDPWYTAQIYFYYAGPLKGTSWPKPARDPNVPSGLIGLEYWFFYPYNYYPTVVAARLMDEAPLAGDTLNTDLHQGDWEHVTVLLDPVTFKPRWLYMARHAYEGRFFPWDSPRLAFDQGHPIVQAAFGGHPTYDNHCGGRPRAAVLDASSDWVVCGSGRFAFRASTTPLVDLAQTSWACWRGHFGEAKPGLEVNAPQEADDVLVKAREFVHVAGPVSPLWQAENGSLEPESGACIGDPRASELTVTPHLRLLKLP